MKERLPNIVFVFSDQHRFCDVGYAGNSEVRTPNLDRLARRGAVFRTTYSNCPVCVPARGTLLTGLHALRHGAAANDLPIRPQCVSIADVLNKAGYTTAYIGNWHVGGAPRDQFITHYNRLGFQYWRANNCNHDYLAGYYDDNSNRRFPIDGYAPEGETTLALQFMEQAAGLGDGKPDGGKRQSGDLRGGESDGGGQRKPFAVFLGYGSPHDPYLKLPEPERERALRRNVTFRENVAEPPRDGEISIEPYDLQKFYAGYYGHIELIDKQVGRLADWLDGHGLFENTIFVYTSDHGDMLGSHGYLNKQMYFDEGSRVPFVISWPGHIPAGEREQLLSLVDVAPSLAGLVGERFEREVDGRDLSDVMKNPEQPGQDYVYLYSYVPCHQAKYRKLPSWRALTDGERLLVTDQAGEAVCMYDTKNDPFQMRDVVDDPAWQGRREQMAKALAGEVRLHDGYMPWQELLKRHRLDDLWQESEAFFAKLFTHC